MRGRRVAAVVAGALAVAGCGGGHGPLVVGGTPPAQPYAGPLRVTVAHVDEEGPRAVAANSGAAGRALECDGKVASGGGGGRWSKRDGGRTPEDGLRLFFDMEQPDLPQYGYRVERREGGRVLYSFDVRGRTKIAVIVAKDQPHRPGWGPDTTAHCDPAEFPRSFTDHRHYGFWNDTRGRRAPLYEIEGFKGSASCGWDGAYFLGVGQEPHRVWYARDPHGQLPADMLVAPYREHATMPPGARDTGYRHGDWKLWRDGDRSRVWVRTPSGVESWPAVRRRGPFCTD
jgi:hypothetical protein